MGAALRDAAPSPQRGSAPRTGWRFSLAEDCALLDAGARWLLFSEKRQEVMEINAAGACLADALSGQRGAACLDDLVGALVAAGLTRPVAEQSVRATLSVWSQTGLIDVHAGAGPVVRRQRLSIGGRRIDIAYEAAGLAELVAPGLLHLEIAGGDADLAETWRLAEWHGLATIARDGRPTLVAEPQALAPAIKTALSEELIDRSEAFSALHAACLVHDGKALLLFGPPGAGKSTLAARLDHAGFQLGSDDLTFLGFDGLVTPVAFPLTTKSGSWPLVERFRPDLSRYPAHMRLDGKQVRYLPPLRPLVTRPIPVGWTICLRREESRKTELVPRGMPAALGDMLGEAFSARGHTRLEDLGMVLNVLGRAASFELFYSDLDEAAALLERTCRGD